MRPGTRLGAVHEDVAVAARRLLPGIEVVSVDSLASSFTGTRDDLDGVIMPAEAGQPGQCCVPNIPLWFPGLSCEDPWAWRFARTIQTGSISRSMAGLRTVGRFARSPARLLGRRRWNSEATTPLVCVTRRTALAPLNRGASTDRPPWGGGLSGLAELHVASSGVMACCLLGQVQIGSLMVACGSACAK